MNDLYNRYEILFLYECKDCNPNGDPLDENRPRTDDETGEATVTDVRIKRTIRDYLLSLEDNAEKRLESGMEILIRDTLKLDGHLSEGKDRAAQFLNEAGKKLKGEAKRKAVEQAVLNGCIDARLFGAALPLGKNEPSLQLTGPVQLSAFSRSLHRVAPKMVQQTAAFAGKATANQKSFAERWLLPYALIAAYGVINEVAAKTTKMTQADLSWLLKGLWHGTAGLNTHSKIGHDPLLMVLAKYKAGRRIGALPRLLSITGQEVDDTAIRSTADYCLDVAALLDAFKECDAVEEIQAIHQPRLRCEADDTKAGFLELAAKAGLPIQALSM